MTQGGLPLVAEQSAVAYTGVPGVVDGTNKPTTNVERFTLAVACSSISSQGSPSVLELYPRPITLEHVNDSVILNRAPRCASVLDPSIESARELCSRLVR